MIAASAGHLSTTVFALLVAATLALAGCGGGGKSPTLTDAELDRLQSDPRIVRLEGILERADTLLVPSLHLRYTLSAQGNTVSDSLALHWSCSGVRCAAEDDTVLTVQDLIDPAVDVDIELEAVNLGSRGKFDTLIAKGRFNADSISNITITRSPSLNSYGFWGEYGFASVEVGDGPWSGRVEGNRFHGDISIAGSYAVGDVTGTNPTGVGGASWQGIAQAASTRTFQLRQGTAIITIPELSRPRVSVEVDVSGFSIGAPGWTDMPLYSGGFISGTVGRDYLEGNFHGPAHEETYGVFDTGAYIGAFGAKREAGSAEQVSGSIDERLQVSGSIDNRFFELDSLTLTTPNYSEAEDAINAGEGS